MIKNKLMRSSAVALLLSGSVVQAHNMNTSDDYLRVINGFSASSSQHVQQPVEIGCWGKVADGFGSGLRSAGGWLRTTDTVETDISKASAGVKWGISSWLSSKAYGIISAGTAKKVLNPLGNAARWVGEKMLVTPESTTLTRRLLDAANIHAYSNSHDAQAQIGQIATALAKKGDMDTYLSVIDGAAKRNHTVADQKAMHEKFALDVAKNLVAEGKDELTVRQRLNAFLEKTGIAGAWNNFGSYVSMLFQKAQDTLRADNAL